MKALFGFRLTLAAALVLSLPHMAQAQDVPTADPGRVRGQIAPFESTARPEVTAPVSSSGGAINAPEGAQNVKFTLKSVAIEGMSAYQQADIAKLYSGQVGTTISLADVYALAERLTAKYRNEGYILTQVIVPPQTIEGGNIKLKVVEGFIDQVSIQGSTRGDIAYLSRYADRIRGAKPLNAKALERYLLLMNDLAGITARAVLSPSKTPGASDVTLVVEQKPYDAFFQVDNRGSRYLGPLQFNAGTRLNNVFGLYEGINVQFVTAPDGFPDRELDYAGITWGQPIGSEGTRLALSGSVTSTEPGFELSQFDVNGLAHNLGLEVSHPFIRSRNENLTATFRFNYLNSERTDNLGLGKTEDRLRVIRLGGSWQFADSLLGINTISGEASKGLGIMNASDKGDASLTRANGDPEFFKGTLEVTRLQRLSDRFELFGSVTGQKSANTLLASEEFGVGGLNYGSAYDSSEITGEDGLAARLELRTNNPFPTSMDLLQLYGFYDAGKVWDIDNAVSKEKRRSVASAGAGFRANLNENFAGTFEAAKPLTRSVEVEDDNDVRLFGSITAKF